MEKEITLCQLKLVFPEDTLWGFNRSEITGYSMSSGLHFTIDDAVCVSEDGEFLLTIYKVKKKYHKWRPTHNRPYPIKHFGLDKIVFQEFIKILDIPDKIDFNNIMESTK